ncbi:MAG: methylated-DNA--[protein]-cysteine S-methyltransferase [Candidatus Hodarchaeales archaeon]
MTLKIYTGTVTTSIGKILIASTINGLCFLTWSNDKENSDNEGSSNINHISELFGVSVARFTDGECIHIKTAQKELKEYFSGKLVQFTVQIDLQTAGTEFQRTVWSELRKIPLGKTLSYGDIAMNIGNKGAARAVGMACARNPLPIIIPCHRVLRSTGNINGYSAPGGVKTKNFLLELEKQVTVK